MYANVQDWPHEDRKLHFSKRLPSITGASLAKHFKPDKKDNTRYNFVGGDPYSGLDLYVLDFTNWGNGVSYVDLYVSDYDKVDSFLYWLTRKLDGESDESIDLFSSASGSVEPEPESNIPGLTFRRTAFYTPSENNRLVFQVARQHADMHDANSALLAVDYVLSVLDERGSEALLLPAEVVLRDLLRKLSNADIMFVLVMKK